MNRQNRGIRNRRVTLLRSLEQSEDGGFTIKGLVEHLDGRPVECTITGYCRTFVFEFPGSYLVAEEPVDHQAIYSSDGLKASIVSDLPAYFEQEPAKSLHYSIDVSLRSGIHSTYGKAVEQSNRQKTQSQVPLFLVIEEYAEIPPTVLNSGECLIIDECRDGEAIIEGGREGKSALLALRTIDGSWPDFHANMHIVNVVLAAVKVEQNITDHIENLYSCSCFVSSEKQAVYTLIPTISPPSVTKRSRLESPDSKEKGGQDRVYASGDDVGFGTDCARTIRLDHVGQD